MQEEVDQKTIALAVNTTKMTGRVLAKAIQMYLQHQKEKSKDTKIHHGKQTIKQLMKQNTGLSNIEITDKNGERTTITSTWEDFFALDFEFEGKKTKVVFISRKKRNGSWKPCAVCAR